MTDLTGIDDLARLTARAAESWPDRTAWVFDTGGEPRSLTFAEVHARSDEFAGALASLGVSPGDRVALMLRNCPEFPLLWLATAKLGAAMVPVNVNYRELDGSHVLADAGARVVVGAPEFVEMLRVIAPKAGVERVLTPGELPAGKPKPELPLPAGEQPVNIQYTSGTTGAPKGCVLPHRYWTTLARGMITEHPWLRSDDVMLTAQPFHYIDPQWHVAVGLASGARLVVLDRFHPSTFWSKVREHGVTWFYCLGMMPTLLLRQPPSEEDKRHRVRAVHASAIPGELHSRLEERWGVPWFEAFGMTETGADIRVRPQDHDEVVGTGCIGTPVPGREVAVLGPDDRPVPRGETGELAIRGVGLMLGYHQRPDDTARAFRNGWFHTGDLVRMDDRGRIYYVGRTKDMIRRSGENISADEVERALLLHPGVRLAAVIGVPDEIRGEEVEAFVVPADGADPTPDELAEHCAAKLAYFKVPRYWKVVDELPMTASERVAKGRLKSADPLAGAYDRVARAWL
ncbi:ATP-dependent acyl-CoA ligase [Thermocrispum sp.]|jgi:crotonobetaine/carnitine-CoA ligase|uniref:ATP-dependent acyl-CoA ligase n=1 Tax=Thermocrispum agreste TaxID=37925 RepID=A0ABD6FDM1_9PSEU|nr:ATP-dependent acyl-CoA ligase [Thermocrispum sp.]